jgi:arginyl-tRNA synthetase
MAPMNPVGVQVKEVFEQALRSAFPSVKQEPLVVKGNPKFGDYQCNNAMGLYKDHGSALGFANPGAIAEAIKKGIPKNDIFGDIIISPQGFVTVKLREDWLQKQVCGVLASDIEYTDAPRKRVVVDFSSPNIAKEMHVGHLRSTIIGESTSRVLEFCGHEVHRLNHVGDWGTQFGMLIEYMKEKYPKFQEQLPDVSDLQEFYKASKRRFDEDDEFKKKAQLSVVDLQAGGEFARSAWQKICDVSRVAFEKIYSRLDIKIEERGESYYNSMIEPIVTELKKRKLCVESKGAMCIFTPRVAEIPLMAVKGDGGYGYDSTDLAAIYHRLFVMRADWVVYITDMGQELHFYMIFDAAMQAGWHRPPTTRCDHMGFGVVQGEDKKKFKTRSGDVVRLVDLFDEAVARAAEEIDKRVVEQEEKNTEVFLKTPEERAAAAEKIGIAAVRYFDMKQNRTSPYVFNYDKMLDPKGNSAVFLFYAYARIRAIQRKSGLDPDKLNTAELRIEHPAERALALKLLQFPDTVKAILAELHLHYLTDFLWELCGLMTQFYTQCHVLGEKEQTSRLLLCEATRKVLLKSFELLGFTPLERI